eukprot:COSAG02_NODE_1327_length_13220_cov_11.602241_3_plen_79_part_00
MIQIGLTLPFTLLKSRYIGGATTRTTIMPTTARAPSRHLNIGVYDYGHLMQLSLLFIRLARACARERSQPILTPVAGG